METLPTKPEPVSPTEVEVIPTWRELRTRFRDLMKDVLEDGKELERELEPKLLPALRRLRVELDRLIAKVEERATAKTEPPPPPPPPPPAPAEG